MNAAPGTGCWTRSGSTLRRGGGPASDNDVRQRNRDYMLDLADAPRPGRSSAATRRGPCGSRCTSGSSPSGRTSGSPCRCVDLGDAEAGLRLFCALRGPYHLRRRDPRAPTGWTGSSRSTRRCPTACGPGRWRSAPSWPSSSRTMPRPPPPRSKGLTWPSESAARGRRDPRAGRAGPAAAPPGRGRRLGPCGAGRGPGRGRPVGGGRWPSRGAAALAGRQTCPAPRRPTRPRWRRCADNNGWGIALAHYGLGWLAMSRQDRAGRCALPHRAGPVPGDRRPAGDGQVPGGHRLGRDDHRRPGPGPGQPDRKRPAEPGYRAAAAGRPRADRPGRAGPGRARPRARHPAGRRGRRAARGTRQGPGRPGQPAPGRVLRRSPAAARRAGRGPAARRRPGAGRHRRGQVRHQRAGRRSPRHRSAGRRRARAATRSG